jgi:DNA polymerase III subunit gamma/tau
VVSVSREEGQPTLREDAEARERMIHNEAAMHPLVRAVLEAFPGARIEAVRDLATEEEELPEAADPVDVAEEPDEGDEFG